MMNSMKSFTALLCLICTHFAAHAQINWSDYSNTSYTDLRNDPAELGLLVNIRNDNSSFSDIGDMDDSVHKLLDDPAFVRMRGDKFVIQNTFDTAKVHFFLHGVNKNTASSYQYRVIEYPNRILVPWTSISRFTDSAVVERSGFPQMPYLGGYRAKLNHTIIVDVRKTGNEKTISTALVHWKSNKPIVTNIYTARNFDTFLKRLQYPRSLEAAPEKISSQVINVPSENSTLVFLLKAKIYRRDQLQYEVVRNGKIVIPWKQNDYDNNFIWLKENRPGNYKLNIRYTVQPQHVTSYQFMVEPTWYQSNVFKIAVGVLVVALSGGFLFLILLVKQKRITREEIANRAKLQLELKAIHAQLNPHFVFNALSSIQGLMNKQDIKGANSYLVEFAKLMRESLNSGNKDEVQLKREIDVLKTYINLEQLRFGFDYQITIDENINTSEINIPSLLLQPLVENAIKHGVSTCKDKGKIDIHFIKADDNLLIIIKDNGKGFNLNDIATGYGLKLTQERIELLNQLKPEQTVVIQNQQLGTEIKLTFNNWFL